MQYFDFGHTGIKISAVSYGGIVSAGNFEGAICPEVSQKGSDRYVAWAIERGVNLDLAIFELRHLRGRYSPGIHCGTGNRVLDL